jgi:adenine-specific DNA-methyltransferase
MTSAFDQLREFLCEMFQYDTNDLDFGIFKILKLKRRYIEQFINGGGPEDLQATVMRELSKVENTDAEAASMWLDPYCEELGKRTRQAWQELREEPHDPERATKLEAAIDALEEDADKAESAKQRVALWVAGQKDSSANIEERLYNYLLNFFELYYQNGDFGYNSRAANAFKVPYEADYDGADTFFHWKHKDSYYIKTGASFPSVKCEVAGKKLEFRLESGVDSDAEATAQNNNKDREIKLYKLARIEETEGVWQVVFHLAKAGTPKTELYPKLWAEMFADEKTDLTPLLFKKESAGETPKPIFNDLAGDYDKTDSGQVKGVNQLRLKEESYYKELAKRPEFAGLGRNEGERIEALKENPTAAVLYRIDKALNQFFVGNDADYFIHKDLRGFLTREKDRFIKNVVFSDLETLLNRSIDNSTLIIARAFNAVADRIIEFLDTLETFQRNIFTLKKKVVDTHWLISVGKIPERFHADIAGNVEQMRQFSEMYGLTIAGVEQLKDHPTLVVDTSLFEPEWTLELLSDPVFDNLDEQINGLLIHSENWQALNLLEEKYRGQVKCIYIDPPYNTGGDEFLYKDSFRHSSWASMMNDRLEKAVVFLEQKGTITQAIGREEISNLFDVSDVVFGVENRVGELIWEKGRKNDARFFSLGHDYMIVYAKDYGYLKASGTIWREEKPGAREILAEWRRLKEIHSVNYTTIQTGIRDFYSNLPAGHISLKHRRYNRVDRNGIWRDDNISWPGGGGPRYDIIHPDTDQPCAVPDRGWAFSTPEKFWLFHKHGFIEFREDHTEPPILKRYLNYVPTDFDPDARRGNGANDGDGEESNVQVMPSVFYKSQQPTVVALRHLMGGDVFKNPKDPDVIGRTLNYMGGNDALCLDFFGGSGTTGHAVIALNKQDGDKGKRKFILVETGAYFDTVLKPRIQKVMYSLKWREGKPIAEQVDGYQGIVKVQRLEQYEDLLANLETAWDGETLPKGVPVQYLFRPEQNRLVASIDFSRPFSQTIKVGKAREERTIDLMETWLYLQGYWVKSRRKYAENGKTYLAVETTVGVLVIFRDVDTGEDDSADLNIIIDRYRGENGEPTVSRLEVNFDADIRRVKLPTTLVQATDFDRGAAWN